MGKIWFGAKFHNKGCILICKDGENMVWCEIVVNVYGVKLWCSDIDFAHKYNKNNFFAPDKVTISHQNSNALAPKFGVKRMFLAPKNVTFSHQDPSQSKTYPNLSKT